MKRTCPIPERVKKLPRDERGYPVPFFVQWFDETGQPTEWGIGKPDQRIADERKQHICRTKNLCWICGDPLTYWIAFVGGPMSAHNAAFADGPMHVECAEFACMVCPHLAHPGAKRRPGGPMDETYAPDGLIETPIEKCCVFITRRFTVLWTNPRKGRFLWRPAPAKEIRWFRAGERIAS